MTTAGIAPDWTACRSFTPGAQESLVARCLVPEVTVLFDDGFELGDVSRWTLTFPSLAETLRSSST